MAHYFFIESRDSFESQDTQFVVETATALKQRGNTVTIFFVQNGVFVAREKAQVSYVNRLSEAGVNLLVDDFSLSERGIQAEELHASIRPSNIDALVDSLVHADTKAVWH
jgi:predicted peroxiredoxin